MPLDSVTRASRYSGYFGPSTYANGNPVRFATGRPGLDRSAVLYLVWGSTYLGIAIAVETMPPFLMAAVRFLLAGMILLTWSIAREGRAFVPPTRREWRDGAIVGALLLGGGHGARGVRRADHPVGHHRPRHRDDAGVGRGPWPHLSPRTSAPTGERRDRRRLRRRRHPRRAIGVRGRRRARSPWSHRRSSSRRSPGRSARCSRRIGPSCRRGHSWRRASRWCSAASCWPSWARSRASSPGWTSARSRANP